MKKVFLILGSLFFVFLVAAVTIPFFIDVDKYRPDIVKVVNENVNGTFKLGKLKLSLWGGVYVNAESMELTVAGEENPMVAAEKVYLEFPFSSLLLFSPKLTVVLAEPKLALLKEKNGKFNFMRIMKETRAKGPKTRREEMRKKQEELSETPTVPVWLAGASLGFRLEKGFLTYNDLVSGDSYKINGVEVALKDVGLLNTMSLDVELPFSGSSKLFTADGTVEMSAKIKPIISGGTIGSATGNLVVDASDLELKLANGSFQKSDSMPLKLKIDFDGTKNDFQMKNLSAEAHTIKLSGKGVVKFQPKMSMKFDFQSSVIDLAAMEEMVPMLKEYQLKGEATTNMRVSGSPSAPKILGNLNLKNGNISYPAMLKAPVSLRMKSSFSMNSFTLHNLEAKAPDTDIRAVATVTNMLKAPKFNVNLNSNSINVDKLIKFPPADKKKSAAIDSSEKLLQFVQRELLIADAYAQKAKKKSIWNPMLPMAKNPMLLAASGVINTKVSKLIAYKTPITNIDVVAKLNNLVLNVERAKLNTFGGAVTANARANLKDKYLSYSSKGKVDGLSAKDALVTYFPKFKNTLEGTVLADWNLSGRAFPEKTRMKSIDGSVNMNAKNGNLSTLDVHGSIKKAMEKVPFLKNKKTPKLDEGFKTLRADMKFKDGVIRMNPFVMDGKGKSLNFKGQATIQENLEHESTFDVYDPHRLLPSEISNGKGVALALKFRGSILKPKPDLGYTAKKLAKKAAKGRGKKLAKKGIDKILGGKKSGGKGGKVLDKLKKFKLF